MKSVGNNVVIKSAGNVVRDKRSKEREMTQKIGFGFTPD